MAVLTNFKADETAEAHFAHAMDNLQPLLLNNSNGGSDWADHDVTAKQCLRPPEPHGERLGVPV